jgi:Zn-dependent protease with chaperone function/type II secretory pathway pseudopilin PulG
MNLVYKHEGTLFAIAMVLAGLFWLAIVVGTVGLVLIYILLGFLIYLFAQSAFISQLKGNGVRITAAQYPDLHRSLEQCCRKVGMQTPPDMYLLRTDFFNALATKFLGRNFIVLFTDVVDALADEPGAIDFYVGHELGHIHRKHLRWSPFLLPAMILPVLGTAYRRAQEYTCDRYGAVCCANERQIQSALAAIAAGNTRWKTLDTGSYLGQIPDTSGFWMSFHEFTSDYPWLTKRMASALALFRNEDVEHPRRSAFAAALSIFVPRIGVGGGGALSVLMVVAIIGILAAIAIPAYQDYTVRAQVAGALDQAAGVRAEVESYRATNDEWPADLLDLGYDEATLVTQYGQEIALYEEGTIGITIGADDVGDPRYLVLEPTLEGDDVSWTCYGQNALPAQLPTACRDEP